MNAPIVCVICNEVLQEKDRGWVVVKIETTIYHVCFRHDLTNEDIVAEVSQIHAKTLPQDIPDRIREALAREGHLGRTALRVLQILYDLRLPTGQQLSFDDMCQQCAGQISRAQVKKAWRIFKRLGLIT